jgi:hypothetical protein
MFAFFAGRAADHRRLGALAPQRPATTISAIALSGGSYYIDEEAAARRDRSLGEEQGNRADLVLQRAQGM